MTAARTWFCAAALLAVACLSACSTPEDRNEGRSDAFTRLTPAQQALVKAGEVAPGFDGEAVKLALGDPDRVIAGRDGSGPDETWLFRTYRAGGVALFTGTYHADRRHGWGWNDYWGPSYPYYLDYPDRVVSGTLRVEFVDQRVSAVVREQR